jgi:hypothetical protein
VSVQQRDQEICCFQAGGMVFGPLDRPGLAEIARRIAPA